MKRPSATIKRYGLSQKQVSALYEIYNGSWVNLNKRAVFAVLYCLGMEKAK